jgi:DNA-binding transcriptional LysR family regulator
MADPPTTLERLRVFHEISTAGTIAGAARSLSYTPSAVSQHLAALERETAASLVERSNRGVLLTEVGRLLAQRAADILDLVRNSFDEVGFATGRHETLISIAAFPTAITTMLLPLRERLAPSIRLAIVDAEPEAALRALGARDVDCAITDGYADEQRPRSGDLHRTVLRTEPIRLVARSDRVESTLAAYADAPWVLGGPGSRIGAAARRTCRAAGFSPNVITETDDHHISFDVVRASGAVSLLPELALADLPDGLAVTPVSVPLERRIEFVTRNPLRTNPAIADLGRLLAGEPVAED